MEPDEAPRKKFIENEYIRIEIGKPPWRLEFYFEPRSGLVRIRRYNPRTEEAAVFARKFSSLRSAPIAKVLKKVEGFAGSVFDPDGWGAIKRLGENMYSLLPKSKPKPPVSEDP